MSVVDLSIAGSVVLSLVVARAHVCPSCHFVAPQGMRTTMGAIADFASSNVMVVEDVVRAWK